MLHFTPLYKPLEGYIRHLYGRGDIRVRGYICHICLDQPGSLEASSLAYCDQLWHVLPGELLIAHHCIQIRMLKIRNIHLVVRLENMLDILYVLLHGYICIYRYHRICYKPLVPALFLIAVVTDILYEYLCSQAFWL